MGLDDPRYRRPLSAVARAPPSCRHWRYGAVAVGIRLRTPKRDKLSIGRIAERLLESSSVYTQRMREHPGKPHHHASKNRHALTLLNLGFLLSNRPNRKHSARVSRIHREHGSPSTDHPHAIPSGAHPIIRTISRGVIHHHIPHLLRVRVRTGKASLSAHTTHLGTLGSLGRDRPTV